MWEILHYVINCSAVYAKKIGWIILGMINVLSAELHNKLIKENKK